MGMCVWVFDYGWLIMDFLWVYVTRHVGVGNLRLKGF